MLNKVLISVNTPDGVKEATIVKADNEDFNIAKKLQKELEFMSKKPASLRFMDAIVTFDELSTANIYHVQLIHSVENMPEAVKCFNRSVKNLCEFSMIASSGDFATRYLIVSHVTPACFEHLLTRNFNKWKTSSLFNIIF